MVNFLNLFKKKKLKPIYSIKPLIMDGRIPIKYDPKQKTYTVPVKPFKSNIVQFVKFQDWKTVKDYFDKESIRIIEDFIKGIEKKA